MTDNASPPAPRRKTYRAQSGLSDEALACGALVDELLEQVATGTAEDLTAHQRTCPHCQASLRELTQLWAPVHEDAAATPSVPDTLVSNVMKGVQTLVRDTWYTLEIADGGNIRVAARVVAVLARDAARRVPGVRVALGRSTASRAARLVEKATLGHRHPHSAVGVLGRTAAVDLALAVTYGPPLRAVGKQVQQAVTAELRQAIGLTNIIVNVTIDDIYP